MKFKEPDRKTERADFRLDPELKAKMQEKAKRLRVSYSVLARHSFILCLESVTAA